MSWLDGLKVIAVIDYALEGNREKFIEVGMGDYIAKLVLNGSLHTRGITSDLTQSQKLTSPS